MSPQTFSMEISKRKREKLYGNTSILSSWTMASTTINGEKEWITDRVEEETETENKEIIKERLNQIIYRYVEYSSCSEKSDWLE